MSNAKEISTEKYQESKLKIPSIGVGNVLTSATWIAVMLMAEDRFMQGEVIASVMHELGIKLEEVAVAYNDEACENCGVSVSMHKDNNGECF